MKLKITNGRIIDPKAKIDFIGTIVIEDGKISEIAKGDIDTHADELFDAEGKVVAPGFIDTHVHFREPGFEYKEDIASGLESAAAGGFTSVMTMPNTNPVTDNISTLRFIKEKVACGNGVKLYPVAAASGGLKGESIAPIGELKEGGAVAISDDGKPIKDTSLLQRVMQYADTFDLKYISHSEDLYLAKDGQMNEGFFSTVYGMQGIPVVGEASQIARECMMAEYLKLPVHIAHVSAAMSVDMIEFFKKRGVKVTAETAPHYLTLTDEALGSYNTNTKINPPLRSAEDKSKLIEAVKNGIIDCIGTDHAPHHEREKNVEFNSAPCGIIGLETALPLVLRLYHQGEITLSKVVELFTAGYSIFNIEGGSFVKGSDADITIFDPDYQYTIDKNMFKSKSKNSPFHGFHVKGAVFRTIVKGRTVYKRFY